MSSPTLPLSAAPAVEIDVDGSAPADHTPLAAVTASYQVIGPGVLLLGWSVIEPTGAAPASFLLLDGQGTDANYVAAVSLTQGAATTNTLGQRGVRCRQGLYLQILSGTVTGAIFFRRLPAR